MRGNAEEGGNGPQRTLLVGGPKHGEFMNFPEGEKSYELTTMQTLGNWPKDASHLYEYDAKLTRAFGSKFTVFSHEVLGGVHHGGFNLHALTEAYKGIEEADANLDKGREALAAAKAAEKEAKERAVRLREALQDSQALLQREQGRLAALRALVDLFEED